MARVQSLSNIHKQISTTKGDAICTAFGISKEHMKKIEIEIADAILDEPIGFEAGGQHFLLYPQTLGQVLLTSKILAGVGYDADKFAGNPIIEAINMLSRGRETVLKAIAVNFMREKSEILSRRSITAYANKLAGILTREDIPTLLITILTRSSNQLGEFMKESGLIRDRERMQKVSKVKQSKNNFVFGRRTIYGQLIDAACARYGWTLDYVLWGISYVNLQMLIQDQESSVFLSDKELKEVHISNDREVINGDDPEALKRYLETL